MDKPKVTFAMNAIVWFNIRGEKAGEFPTCPRDGGLVGRFNDWLMEAKLSPLVFKQSGGGTWIGGFHADDAIRVEAWLLAEGVERVNRGAL